MKYNVEVLKKNLQARLRPDHYAHCLRTAETAARMASAFSLDEHTAYVAGLLHDCTKSMGHGELLTAAEGLGFDIYPVERRRPYLLHAKIAARLAQSEFGVDEQIAHAIECHTFGALDMSELDKVIYVADLIEPGRPYEGLDRIRRIALEDLDEAFRAAYIQTLGHVVKTQHLIHPMTLDVWNKLIAE
ncbi:MAG TPA: bis(5'-nucleosyl)-tetraphosphatase (symmetrical) YqeK [Candidatus Aquicultor sp.]|jgi:predicted HD superfamily hydrolase involved in NAD metabolism